MMMENLKYMADKFKNLFLLGLCFLYAPFRGKATKNIENPSKILILQMAKLGDMVCTTPMFRAVKEKYPHAKLYVIGNALNRELLEGSKDVDEYIISNKYNFWQLAKQLRRERIDFACQTAPNFGYLAMLYLAGIPQIATPKIENGFCPWETRAYKMLRPLVIVAMHQMEHYAPREYLRLLEPINIFTDNTQKHLSYSERATKKAGDFLEVNSIDSQGDIVVGISVSAGNKIKNWPSDKWIELITHLVSRYNAKVVLIGSKYDKEETDKVLNALKPDIMVYNALEQFTVDELKAFIGRIALLIAVDTGPIYIAEALGVPTVDIVGPVDEREQPPVGKIHRIVKLENRIPAVHIMNARFYDPIEARRQIEEIEASSVISSADEILHEINRQN